MMTRPNYRALIAYAHDIGMAALSFPVALYLRLGADGFAQYPADYLLGHAATLAAVCGVVSWMTGLYRGIWRYASLDDMLAIGRAVSITIVVFTVLVFIATRLEMLPRSSLVINWFVLAAMLAGPRALYRVLKDGRLDTVLRREGAGEAMRRIPVVLVGAGDPAETFIREMDSRRDAPFQVIGILADRSGRVGREIRKVDVLGTIDEFATVLKGLTLAGRRPQRLIVTKEDIDPARLSRLVEEATAEGLTLARLPRLTDLRDGVDDPVAVRPVAIEDLLGRPQAVLERDRMRALVAGRRVLVTGAGGTIGGELVRQIAAFGPTHLALLDASEFNLYTIDMEMAERHPDLPRTAILADVRDRLRVDAAFQAAAPELVFHAGALKHVPMVELNPLEGVMTNAAGTRNVADACRATGVLAMVLISTDKAVNPVNVMGATKRLAESYCQSLDLVERRRERGTRFVTVRFGNVLGSTGSVVPLFQRQLAAGGPLTVTHPEMTRYFMTVREAVELVLQASVLGVEGDEPAGEIFVLDMGEPVRILDLARQMIRLAGRRPDTDVQIAFVGLRPGEKMTEELFHDSEALMSTAHPAIRRAAPRTVDAAFLARGLDEIVETARAGRPDATLAMLQRLVPDYRPQVPEQAAAGE
ncbi:O-antigen biosynthesis protein WbqV [Stella humosa]|uniref:O-antigen biosynthesis protein WbqV n=1 Tax=Stella humosa TaxID=94 RepID=A0A3N1KND8_9PROT|nr:nucleoside-diphosphate sugar epimerase/dehydratase [Stella humosa]ROP80867.1 O-antigen biosynthesis protein WbqV [Stella humosa]BBK33340.1 polysaccharide biosynthesis protein CapD [Stella humosa]